MSDLLNRPGIPGGSNSWDGGVTTKPVKHSPEVRGRVMVHSDQGCQFIGSDWQSLLKAHRIVLSMSRRENCHDNAVAESFSSVLKKDRIKRRIYPTGATAALDVFDYIDMFFNPIRLQGSAGGRPAVEFVRRYVQSGDCLSLGRLHKNKNLCEQAQPESAGGMDE